MVAPVQVPRGDNLDQDTRAQGTERAQDQRKDERPRQLEPAGRHVCTDHVERTMGKIDEVHDAEDEREPGGHQKQHHPQLYPVEQLFEQKGGIHQRLFGAARVQIGRSCPDRHSNPGDLRRSTREGATPRTVRNRNRSLALDGRRLTDRPCPLSRFYRGRVARLNYHTGASLAAALRAHGLRRRA